MYERMYKFYGGAAAAATAGVARTNGSRYSNNNGTFKWAQERKRQGDQMKAMPDNTRTAWVGS